MLHIRSFAQQPRNRILQVERFAREMASIQGESSENGANQWPDRGSALKPVAKPI
jgi:hypothetical protein